MAIDGLKSKIQVEMRRNGEKSLELRQKISISYLYAIVCLPSKRSCLYSLAFRLGNSSNSLTPLFQAPSGLAKRDMGANSQLFSLLVLEQAQLLVFSNLLFLNLFSRKEKQTFSFRPPCGERTEEF